MDLTETFQIIAPSIVAFVRTLVFSPDGKVPLSPVIFATGFIVDPVGIVVTNRHVIEAFSKVPEHPKTGKPAIAVMLFHYGQTDEGKAMVRWVPIAVKYYGAIDSFDATGRWFGQRVPDVGFVQLMVQDVQPVELAIQDNYIRMGMPIATAGFPMGDVSLTALEKVNQMTPFLRHGIVSSMFPFPVPQPHGFTIDVVQQGGSSGSPIFYSDKPTVVGMMSESLLDSEWVERQGKPVEHIQNTNISICVTSVLIQHALENFKRSYPPKLEGVPTLAEHLATVPMATSVGWENLGPTI